MTRNFRINLLAALFILSGSLHAVFAGADLSAKSRFNISSQPLQSAVVLFTQQSGIQITSPAELFKDRRSAEVVGDFTATAALAKLLSGTDLRYRTVDPNTIVIVTSSNAQSALTAETAMRLAEGSPGAENTPSDPNDNRVGSNVDAHGNKIEEIVVTAQKRVERLQDVPVPISVVNAESLVNSAQLRLQDYYAKIPGLGLALIGDGSAPSITIRGITTGGITNPTVGIVVDEVSYGATVSPGIAPTAVDIDPSDLARVEVLRGPQGTLYGASSIGGLLKYVTVDPSTEALSGRIQTGLTSVRHGSDVGYSVRGSINVPLGDTFAVRASGFTTREPGYVDNLTTGQSDINRRDSNGGRLSALWRPSEDFSLKLSALFQDSNRKGTQDVDSTLGGALEQRSLIGTGLYQRKTQAYSATMKALLGTVDLTSATGYSVDQADTAIDLSLNATYSNSALANFGVTGVRGPLHRSANKFTQEVRASVPFGAKLDGLLGAFYTHENVQAHLVYMAANPATGAAAGTILTIDQPTTYEEYAAFTDLTVSFTDRFDVQFGARLSENTEIFSTVRTGPISTIFYGGNPSIVPVARGTDRPFTYLVTPRFKMSPDLMLYARLASGYRPGGPNANCSASIPCNYSADTTQNYEAGFKGNLLGRLLSFDASVYYIDWKDMQIPLTTGVLAFNVNASRAKSQGVELSLEARPATGLTLSAWGAWNDAELTEALPTTSASSARGLPGDRLPYSSRFSGNFSVEQTFPLGRAATASVQATAIYVDDRKGVFKSVTQVRETYPAYTQLDLSAGLSVESWTLNAFVTNAADKRGVLRSGLDSLRPTLLAYIQPRTVGISLSKTFQ